MFRKILLSISLSIFLFGSNINIAVASNVSYAINSLIKEFNQTYPNIKVNPTIGSSGKLTLQIKYGARYDIFISANMLYPNSLYKEHIAITKPIIYAKGSLVLLSTKNRDFIDGVDILKSNQIKKIAIANPKTAPYGKATDEVLKNTNLYKQISSKLIYGESISQTLRYTISACDIGFVAKSLLFSKSMRRYKKDINYIDIPLNLYTPISQGIVLLKRAKSNNDAKLFYNFMLSKKAKNILKDFGYII